MARKSKSREAQEDAPATAVCSAAMSPPRL